MKPVEATVSTGFKRLSETNRFRNEIESDRPVNTSSVHSAPHACFNSPSSNFQIWLRNSVQTLAKEFPDHDLLFPASDPELLTRAGEMLREHFTHVEARIDADTAFASADANHVWHYAVKAVAARKSKFQASDSAVVALAVELAGRFATSPGEAALFAAFAFDTQKIRTLSLCLSAIDAAANRSGAICA